MPLPATRHDPTGPALAQTRHPGRRLAAEFGDDDLRRMCAAYYGQVSYVDHLLGILLEALISSGRFDDTLLIFTSDHGEMLGSHVLFKGEWLCEELVNVPLLIKPPTPGRGVAPARQTARLVTHAGLLPTILRWCGAAIPEGLHGNDIRPLVEGGDGPIHDGIALEYYATNWGEHPVPLRGWRTADWKYVELSRGPGVREPFQAPEPRAVPVEL